ncbi:hypothetical protein C4K00_3678 [Pseudomonas synxantha]|nr:hypothetical protein C4K00_3678 [Pseudomonas synxantha]
MRRPTLKSLEPDAESQAQWPGFKVNINSNGIGSLNHVREALNQFNQ